MEQLKDLLSKSLGTIAGALVSAGFVAFVGGAILWARFDAAQLPADQAVAVVSRAELIAVGAAALAGFAVLGGAAVLLVRLIDAGGRANRGTGRALTVLGGAEILIALLVTRYAWWSTVLIAIGLALVAAATLRMVERRRFALVAFLLVGGLILLGTLEGSLAVSVVTAIGLGAICFAIAHLTGDRFWPVGIAVFASVAVFGGVLSYSRTVRTPKVQAAAIIGVDDGRALCGLYIGETDDRVYLGRIAVKAASDGRPKARRVSGRVFSVERSRVASLAIGPLQALDAAQDQAVRLRAELLGDAPRAKTRTAVAPLTGSAADPCAPNAPGVAQQETTQRSLAKRFQPAVVVDTEDGFWPVSVRTLLELKRDAARTCLQQDGGDCELVRRITDIPFAGDPDDWLEYPGRNASVGSQSRSFRQALVELHESTAPARSARLYYLVTGGRAGQPLPSLQYWFFYTFNYQPVGERIARAGFHEGDFESMGLLLSARTRKPVYVWMARHDDEGQRFAWGEPALERAGEHLRVYAARGSHATYESCGRQRRPEGDGFIDDEVDCSSRRQRTLEPSVTPISDLARAPWACWPGRFGHSVPRRAVKEAKYVVADGPRSPLWQQNFGAARFEPCRDLPPPSSRSDEGEEGLDDATAEAIQARAGSLRPHFDSCPAWFKAPTSGAYVVACEPQLLARFFDRGLEDPGAEGLRVSPRGTGRGAPLTVPAVFRSDERDDLERVLISADRPVAPTVYVVRYAGKTAYEATFPRVAVAPGRRLRIVRDDTEWRLVDGRNTTVARAAPTRVTPAS